MARSRVLDPDTPRHGPGTLLHAAGADGQDLRQRFLDLSARIPRLDEALIDILVLPLAAPGPLRPAVWLGSSAPPDPPRVSALAGTIVEESFASEVMGEARRIGVYRPPGVAVDQALPVICLADGASMAGYAHIPEGMIIAGDIPPVMMVGLWPGSDRPRASSDGDWRTREYVLRHDDGDNTRVMLHDRFWLEEVLPLAETRYGASRQRDQRFLVEQSNGGAWALQTARRHPHLVDGVLGISIARGLARDLTPLRETRVILGAGAMEPSVLALNTIIATRADEQELKRFSLEERVAGLSPFLRNVLFSMGIAAEPLAMRSRASSLLSDRRG